MGEKSITENKSFYEEEGGSLFPIPGGAGGSMTMREYYAGCALTGLLSGPRELPLNEACNEALNYADELLYLLRARRDQ